MQLDRADYYERAYWRKFIALFDSLGQDFRDSYGRTVPHLCRPAERAATRPDFPIRGGLYRPREVRWIVGYRGDIRVPQFSHVRGLVCLVEFGQPSRLRVDITYDSDRNLCRLNDVPLTALHMRRKLRGQAAWYWTTTLYFQIDCRREMALFDAARAIKRLRRSRKSYFSWLPKELLALIQALVLYSD
jgi:hypothetical protein